MSGLVLAILVAVAGVVASGLWFGVLRRRRAETELGVQALANLKWRDCIAVVIEALHRDGYQRSAVADAPAGGATEVMLTRNGQDVLLEYKHGTAYQLTEANVREFVNNVSLNGAREGILVSLGSAGPGAALVAATHNVQLIGGESLWPKVRNFLVPSLLESVRAQASARTRNGLWAGAAASLLAGGAVYLAMGGPGESSDVVVAEADVPSAVPVAAQQSRSDAAMLKQISATAKAMEEVSKLTPEQLAQRRVEAAKRVSALPRVQQAAWSAQRTLLVTLRQSADEQSDNQLLAETCRVLVLQEEMRFTRVQLEASNASQRVRWRLCE
jgi:hypothetical protein